MSDYTVTIKADGQHLFKLWKYRWVEEVLNKKMPLAKYSSEQTRFRKMHIIFTAFDQFSLSFKEDKINLKSNASTLECLVNIDSETLKEIDAEQAGALMLEYFGLVFEGLYEDPYFDKTKFVGHIHKILDRL